MADRQETLRNYEQQLSFINGLTSVSETTKNDYDAKLRTMRDHVVFDGEEGQLIDFLKTIENPNTRMNKTNALIRLRRHHEWETDSLASFMDGTKSDIKHHRKTQAKANLEKMMPYEDLLGELDKMHGAQYFMNHMYCHHAMRNQDINCIYKNRLGRNEPVNENTLVFNPKAKKPKMTLHVVDYKTASTYGPKKIVLNDKRLFEELNSMGLSHNTYVFATKAGKKPTLNHMNLKAAKDSINGMGEGRIAKHVIKHLIDNDKHEEVTQISQSRGTAIQTLYTHYNNYDNNPN